VSGGGGWPSGHGEKGGGASAGWNMERGTWGWDSVA